MTANRPGSVLRKSHNQSAATFTYRQNSCLTKQNAIKLSKPSSSRTNFAESNVDSDVVRIFHVVYNESIQFDLPDSEKRKKHSTQVYHLAYA